MICSPGQLGSVFRSSHRVTDHFIFKFFLIGLKTGSDRFTFLEKFSGKKPGHSGSRVNFFFGLPGHRVTFKRLGFISAEHIQRICQV